MPSSEVSTVTTVQNTMEMPFKLIIQAKTQQQQNMLNETQNRQTGRDSFFKELGFQAKTSSPNVQLIHIQNTNS